MIITTYRTSVWAGAVLLATGAALLGGCASSSDLIAEGRVTVEPRIDRTLRRAPEAYESKRDLVVSGRLGSGLPPGLGGHMDVTVTAPDGRVVYNATVTYHADTVSLGTTQAPRHGFFRRAHARYGRYAIYYVRFPGLPPEGSVIKVKYDPEPHLASTSRQ